MLKKNRKGFTLVELVVIMVILGILVLYAAPKFLNFKGKAELTQIKNDVRIAEDLINEHLIKYGNLPSGWRNMSAGQIRTFANEQKVYDKKGLTNNIEENTYKEIDDSFLRENISTKLKGKFYANKEGTTYYADINSSDLGDLGEEDFDFIRDTENVDKNDNLKLKVISYEFPNGIYKYGDTASGKIKVQGVQAGNYQVNFALIHSKSGNAINGSTNFNIAINEIKDIDFSHLFVVANRLGFYDLCVVINEGATVITSYYVPQTIYLGSNNWEYFYDDDFNKMSMASIGGIGKLVPENVDFSYYYDSGAGIDYSSAVLNIHANSNETGQIATKLPMTYGTYEARLKVPDSDALLNGFFLYGFNPDAPEMTYEVDVEILYKDSKWQVWTTIFNPTNDGYDAGNGLEPGAIYHAETPLAFNPSAGFHNYKINFYRNYVSFMLDDVEISRWEGTFDYNDMHLYASTFYTHWLSKNISSTDKKMEIEWIRRAYIPQ